MVDSKSASVCGFRVGDDKAWEGFELCDAGFELCEAVAKSAFDVLACDIDFEVCAVSDALCADHGGDLGVRDQRYREGVVLCVNDGKACAIDSDVSFGDDIAHEVERDAKGIILGIAFGDLVDHFDGGVYVALDIMPTDGAVRAQRAFEVDGRADLERSEVAAFDRFGYDIDTKGGRCKRNDGEADTVDSDAIADLCTIECKLCVDGQAKSAILGFDVMKCSEFFDDSAKHVWLLL